MEIFEIKAKTRALLRSKSTKPEGAIGYRYSEWQTTELAARAVTEHEATARVFEMEIVTHKIENPADFVRLLRQGTYFEYFDKDGKTIQQTCW